MKVNGVNNSIRAYSINKLNRNSKIEKVENKDKIEISSIGKSLMDFSNDFNRLEHAKRVEDIKMNLENGTYKVDAKRLSERMIKYMGERKYEN